MVDDYGTIKTRIADEIQRTDIASQIALAVQEAIRFFQMRRFYFNETRDSTFNTVASQEFYDTTDSTDIPNYLKIDTLTITTGGTSRFPLKRRDWDWIDNVAVNTLSLGQPTDYAYFQQKLRLYPIPDQAYPLRMAGLLRLAALDADTDTNAWIDTNDAELLIRSHAKWTLANDVTFDDDLARRAQVQEARALDRLQSETRRRLGTGLVRLSWL